MDGRITIPVARLHELVTLVFQATGNAADDAATIARHLVEANLAGHESHGVIRVPLYVAWQAEARVVANRRGRIVRDHGAVVTIDGELGYGQVVGEVAVREGIGRARHHGVALVALNNAGHLGRIGGWAELAAAAGLVSLHFVNSPGRGGIQVAPHGARERRLAPNPLAIGVPRAGAPPLVLDITASVVPEGKVRVALNEGRSLPPGAIIDAAGRPSGDPRAFYGPPAGALLPIGGHKGAGLCMMIDLLAGALDGGGCSDPRVDGKGNNMMSIFIDPGRLAGDGPMRAAAADLADWVKTAAPLAPGDEVLVPGEREARLRTQRTAAGVPLDPATRAQIVDTATRLGIPGARVQDLATPPAA